MFGGLWYYVYPNWSYLDGMWSYAPFLTHYMVVSANDTSLNPLKAKFIDVAHQLDLLWKHDLIKAPTGGHLLVYGYDASKSAIWTNTVTGASPIVWDRSLGWYAMALVDTIEEMEAATAGVEMRLRHHFRIIAKGIALAADRDGGLWYQVMNPPVGANLALYFLESSGSAMFVYTLLKGTRLGYLTNIVSDDDDKYVEAPDKAQKYKSNFTSVANKAYQSILHQFVVHNGNGTLGYNGTVEVCSLNSTASYEVLTILLIDNNTKIA